MTEELPIILDSSIYKQNPKLNSQLFILLKRYTRIGKFKIFISEIVENEYLTWVNEKAQNSYQKVSEAIKSLDRLYNHSDFFGFELNITSYVAEKQINEILNNIRMNWDNFKKDTNATMLPIKGKHGSLVMNSYFKGDPPFKKIKNRDDIPDAFIYYALLDLLSKHEKVIFISSDKNLIKSIKNKNIIIFENLTELFKDKNICITEEYFSDNQGILRINKLFKYFHEEIIENVETEIRYCNSISDIEEELLTDIIGKYSNVSSEAKETILNIKSINMINNSTFTIEFSSNLICEIDSQVEIDDLKYYSKDRIDKLSEKTLNDEGFYNISETYKIPIKGNLSIFFDNGNPLEWEKVENKNHFFPKKELKEITIKIENIEKK